MTLLQQKTEGLILLYIYLEHGTFCRYFVELGYWCWDGRDSRCQEKHRSASDLHLGLIKEGFQKRLIMFGDKMWIERAGGKGGSSY